jgi:hypothetical protein
LSEICNAVNAGGGGGMAEVNDVRCSVDVAPGYVSMLCVIQLLWRRQWPVVARLGDVVFGCGGGGASHPMTLALSTICH